MVKVTRPGTFGDYYEVIDGRIHQFDCTPADYLNRMDAWQILFGDSGAAPVALGITVSGQIVTRQPYISGEPPTQAQVDDFLIGAQIEAVKQRCWLWKKVVPDLDLEVWIGDARADNFVSTPSGIVPIDIRLWMTRGTKLT